jgi:hypothetical protein
MRAVTRLAVVSLLGGLSACAASSPEPPSNDPYFPAALQLTPDGATLFVASANADLKYGAGAIHAYDLATVAQLVDAWQGGEGSLPAGCTASTTRRELADCPSTVSGARASYVVAAVQIGNFVSGLGLQTLDTGEERVFATVRGDPSLTFLDWNPGAGVLDCGGSGSFPRCDAAHRLEALRGDLDEPFSPEPFGVGVDGPGESAVITHLATGLLTLVRAPIDGSPPELTDQLTGIWAPNTSGFISAVSAAPRRPGDPAGFFYVTSRSEARVNMVRAAPDAQGLDIGRLVLAGFFFYSPSPGGSGIDADARGLAFTASGDRMVMVSRSPSSLLTIDTSLDAQGRPRNAVIGQVEICSQASGVAIDERADGRLLAYVPCFSSGEVWAVDLVEQRLAQVMRVGRGPAAVAVDKTHKLAYVAEYGQDTITVIDLDPDNVTYHHAVLVLGHRRIR